MFGFFELQLPSRLQTRLTETSNQQSIEKSIQYSMQNWLAVASAADTILAGRMSSDSLTESFLKRNGQQTLSSVHQRVFPAHLGIVF